MKRNLSFDDFDFVCESYDGVSPSDIWATIGDGTFTITNPTNRLPLINFGKNLYGGNFTVPNDWSLKLVLSDNIRIIHKYPPIDWQDTTELKGQIFAQGYGVEEIHFPDFDVAPLTTFTIPTNAYGVKYIDLSGWKNTGNIVKTSILFESSAENAIEILDMSSIDFDINSYDNNCYFYFYRNGFHYCENLKEIKVNQSFYNRIYFNSFNYDMKVKDSSYWKIVK